MRHFKLIAMLLALAMLLTACTGFPETPSRQTDPAPANTQQTESVPNTAEPVRTEPAQPLPTEKPETVMPELPPIARASSAQELISQLSSDVERMEQLLHPGDGFDPGDDPGGDPGAEDTGIILQVPGVEEADSFKTDGSCLYLLDSFGLTIARAGKESSRILSYTQVERQGTSGSGTGRMEGLYVWKDRVAVVYSLSDYGTDADGSWYDTTAVHAAVFDTANQSEPVLLTDAAVDGAYRESRMVNGVLYLITTHRPLNASAEDAAQAIPGVWEDGTRRALNAEELYLCPNSGNLAFTVAAALSMEDGTLRSCQAFTDVTDAVFMDRNDLYLARSFRNVAESTPYREEPYTVTDRITQMQTEIKRLSIGEDGGLTLTASAVISGGVVNQYAMDVEDGMLRIAVTEQSGSYSVYTDENHGWTNYEIGPTVRSGAVTVLDRELEAAGTLSGLAPDTRIFNCRFLDSTALLTTCADADPVYVIDLSDPTAPVSSGELTLPGLNTYLHQYADDLIIGFGDSAEEYGLQLYMLDVSDPASVSVKTRKSLPEYGYSPALADSKALMIAPEDGLIAFPADGSGEENYVLCAFDGSRFSKLGGMKLKYLHEDSRALTVDGTLYVCSSGVVYVVDPENLELLATVTNAEG